MNVRFFELVGKFGGVGGIALGVFLLIVLQIVKNTSHGTKPAVLGLFKMISFFAWILGVGGLVVWALTLNQSMAVTKTNETDRVGRDKISPQIDISSSGDYIKNENNKTHVEHGVVAGRDITGSTIILSNKK